MNVTNPGPTKICVVTTAYYRDLQTIKKLIQTASPQKTTLVIVNNNGDIQKTLKEIKVAAFKIIYLTKNEHFEIAKAFNLTAAEAFKQKCLHLLLLNQDRNKDLFLEFIDFKSSLRIAHKSWKTVDYSDPKMYQQIEDSQNNVLN